jgi:hypothetical protein
VEVIIMFVLGQPALNLAKIAFAFWKFQENQAFQVLGWLMVNASEEMFSNAWLGHSLLKNWIAEVTIMFALGCLSSKLAEIAFAFWKFKENHAFQVWGATFNFVVNASKETFSNAQNLLQKSNFHRTDGLQAH